MTPTNNYKLPQQVTAPSLKIASIMQPSPERQQNCKTEERRLNHEQYSALDVHFWFVPFPSLKPQQMGFTAPLDSHPIQTI